MKKNVAGQSIGAQLFSAIDGSAITSAASVFVQGDTGSQSAGAGSAPTHRGNGFHTYEPTQAETNFDCVAFTFTATDAVPATVRVYTTYPQSVDIPTAAVVVAAVLAAVVEGSYTVVEYLRGYASVLFGKFSESAGTVTFRDIGDTKNRVVVATAASGRTSVTLDLTLPADGSLRKRLLLLDGGDE